MAIARGNVGLDASSSDPVNVSVSNTEVSPMFVAVVYQGTQTVSSVNWNGSEALSLLGTGDISSGLVTRTKLYAIKNPTTGIHNVTVDLSAAPGGGGAVHVICTTGGDTTTGWRSVFTKVDTGSGSPQSTTITLTDSVSGDLVISSGAVYAASFTFAAGQDSTGTQSNNIAGSGFSGGISSKAATGASETVGMGSLAYFGEVAVCAIPAAGGGGTVDPEVFNGGSCSVIGAPFYGLSKLRVSQCITRFFGSLEPQLIHG